MGRIDDPSEHGLATAAAASGKRLSKTEAERAASTARSAPLDYELDRRGALVVRGEVMVSGLDQIQLARIEKAGFRVVRRSDIPDLELTLAIIAVQDMSAERALAKLRRIEPRGSYALNHVLFESGASHAPAETRQTPGPARDTPVTVGLIDTGVAAQVEAATRVQVVRRNFAPTASASAQHGTAVASLLAREPGRVTIYAADIFGSGPRGGTSELLIRALGWMVSAKVPVVNVSMVGPSNDLVAAVVQQMIVKGFTIVAPVGNDGAAARPMFPASYPGVVAVSGAGTDSGLLPEASRVTRVDFVAPAIATVPGLSGAATLVRGTSFAAPIVSRLLAEQVRVPDPSSAKAAIRHLAETALRPKDNGKWFGQGLVGMNSARVAGN